jgi:PTH1 family peptidyl-tRNA hydrolase
MFLIVGLGNPGGKYKKTRHNLGFYAVGEFQKENEFPVFKFSKKFNAEISEGVLDKEKVVLAKPQTFMNSSGQAVKKIIKNLKLKNLIVVHDDIDLSLAKIRISKGAGSAGHKGVESIIKELGRKDFVRIRLGIQPKTGKPKKAEEFVLKKFNNQEKETMEEAVQKATEAVRVIIEEGPEKAMNEFNN